MEKLSFETGFFIGIDIGTTNIRACLFDASYRLLLYEQEEIKLIHTSENELYEIDPDDLWSQFRNVVFKVVESVSDKNSIISVGLSCQRNTFVSWDMKTQKPCHRLVTWKDGRGRQACEECNNSFRLKMLNAAGMIGHFFTGSQRFKTAKILKFINAMVTHRFLATLKTSDEMKTLLEEGSLAIGCMDTWILYRLTKGRVFITEPSSISTTGLYDPFLQDYGYKILRMFGFPAGVRLPELVDTTGINVTTDSEILDGLSLKFGASIGDAQAAAFGAGCHSEGHMSICLGTGAFMDLAIGERPRANTVANSGVFPLVGWKIEEKYQFMMESHMNCSAAVLNWAVSVGVLDQVEHASDLAFSALPADDLYFIPATGFDDVRMPETDKQPCAGLFGLHFDTSKSQIIRALLEFIAYSVALMYESCKLELHDVPLKVIRLSGGVSSNDFLCQQLANLMDLPIERVADNRFCASRGAAFLAGIASGTVTLSELSKFVLVEKIFHPEADVRREITLSNFEKWKVSQKKFFHFNA